MLYRLGRFLAGVGVDKYIHFNACLFIAFGMSTILSLWVNLYVATLVGFCLTFLVGVVKELLDARIDKMDIVADVLGALTGCLMSLM